MKKQLLIISAIFIGSITLLSLNSNEMSQEPWEVPAKYKKMKNPYLDKSDSENIGRILYSKHCKSCHGKKGLGDGTKAESVDTKMPDLTSADFKKQTDGSLYYKTYIGRDDMPSFNKKITDKEDQWMVINYIKNL
ncbi:MAG: c-type cytochrome [Bacteroidetes bacterium]|nr:c-type cytochrome [Bacteroidota bacterium]